MMSFGPTSGKLKIISLVEGNPPVGVSPAFSASQTIFLNGQVTTWDAQNEDETTYRLSVGNYPYVGVLGKKVTASIFADQNMEWIVTYREVQDAYTVSPVNDTTVGWTVASSDERAEIVLKPIATLESLPPRFLATQLFQSAEVDE